MTSDELRAAFLSFFESKGHKVMPSSSLIPHGDPTLLLTTAGMVQFKPYFLGEETPPNPRLASCQKCFRTTDIESVGDATHLTFFEMLGNFSIGDYFKKEAIAWAWEFVTQRLKLPPERLWATIYLDDEEAFRHWRELGVPEARIVRLGEKDNFWGPAGDSGPCGPCSEIHYDFGKEFGCGQPDCAPGHSCGRFSEIWNLVFTQYNQDKEGKRTPLPRPNIDTGAGLERVAAVVQGKTSVYQTDLFVPLLDCISKLSGRKYGADGVTDNAMRIVAEHSRGIAFLIADGVMPSNEGRGYVLRRLLRRAALFGRRLGLEKPFLAETALTTIKQMGYIYPELQQKRDFILKVIEQEETRFGETLDTGLELLDEIMGKTTKRSKKVISGEEAFKLHDTYGFPVELTREIAAERGFSIDLAGFEKEMAKQRERGKATAKFGILEGVLTPHGFEPLKQEFFFQQKFVGYKDLSVFTKIESVNLYKRGKLEEGQEGNIVLAETPFYGEMGGQVGDTGEIRSSKGRFLVTNAVRGLLDVIVLQGKVTQGSLNVGDEVEAEVDEERRRDIARNHTATHLLQSALRQIVGEHVEQRGSLVAPERFRFDFSHLIALSKEEIDKVQRLVNERIRQNLAVYHEEVSYQKAKELGAMALFGEKYGDVVRLVRIGQPPISAELCGGTHVSATGEIGFFRIISESSIGSGLRRIEAVTGRGAEKYISQRLLDLEQVARHLETKPDEVVNQAQTLVAELKNERKRTQSLASQLARKEAEAIAGKAREVGGIKVLAEIVSQTNIDNLREMSDILRNKLSNAIVVLGTVWEDKPTFVVNVAPTNVDKGYDAREIVKRVAAVTGGGGGGKANLAQGSGKDKSKLDEALEQARKYIKEKAPK